MKQNLIIILLTAAVVLLGVNLLEGHSPASAKAKGSAREWTPFCSAQNCYVISAKGFVHDIEDTFKKITDNCVATELRQKKAKDWKTRCHPWNAPINLSPN